ncbi:MAG: hypothetical protein R2749_17300 [Acidimicrobiales bacterium]
MRNGPERFAGRRVGALVSDGVDAGTLASLRAALEAEGAMLQLVAPTVGGVRDSEGNELAVDGSWPGAVGAVRRRRHRSRARWGRAVAADHRARTFLADAHAHAKFIARTETAAALFAAAGLGDDALDEGHHLLDGGANSAEAFIAACRGLRHWARTEAMATP